MPRACSNMFQRSKPVDATVKGRGRGLLLGMRKLEIEDKLGPLKVSKDADSEQR